MKYRGKHEIPRKGGNRKGKAAVLLAALLLLITIGVGSTIAYLMDSTDAVTNTFQAVKVESAVTEEFDGGTKSSVIVTNNNSIPVYVRATMAIYWTDGNGVIVEPTDCYFAPDPVQIGSDWITVGDIYYYKYPVAVNGETSNLLAAPIQAHISPENSDYRLHVDIFAESLQANPTNAVNYAWGSHVQVNTDGTLSAKGGT